MMLDEWLFELPVMEGRDAHNTLVSWLKTNGYIALFTENHKSITYVVFHGENGPFIVARSCMPIHNEIVQSNSFTIDFEKPIKVVVQLSVKKKVRLPKLIHEAPTSVRKKATIRKMTNEEKFAKVYEILDALGFAPEHTIIDIRSGLDITIQHKRDGLTITEPTMNVVIFGPVIDRDKFISGWRYGVGNKRVYGLGCVRVLE